MITRKEATLAARYIRLVEELSPLGLVRINYALCNGSGLSNDEVLCVCCPSADACYAIGKVFKLKTNEGEEYIETCHSTTLDRLHIVQTR